jgi:ATP-dependent helicase Lhr and Lhr-like helicase
MQLPVAIETRTGDTPHSKRIRQRQKPPDILITTPEQVSLLVADPHAAHMLKGLRTVILDELHSMVTSKRGVLLSLALSRVQAMAPEAIGSDSRPRWRTQTRCAPGWCHLTRSQRHS